MEAKFSEHYQLHERALAFRASGSAKDILLALEVPETERSSIMIAQITADYWGYWNKSLWDWMEAVFKAELNG